MKKILIYQHQSSYNHGCEALAYTISNMIKEVCPDSYITLSSFYAVEDKKFEFPAIDKIVQNDNWLKRGTLPYFVYQIDKRLLNNKLIQEKFMYCKTCYELAKEADICVAIGGDNYCYNKGKEHWPLERKMKKLGKKMFLWGCSLEPDEIKGELAEHLSLFDVITPRESETYNALVKSECRAKIVMCSDPAFTLPVLQNNSLDDWKDNKIIGLNLSPMVLNNSSNSDKVKEEFDNLIKYILNDTEYNIAFIPHVRLSFSDDVDAMKPFYEKYKRTNRVKLIDDELLNARQLKGIISQCDIFIGARTHSIVAAYSTCVPAIALGYSIKAKGIAEDLLGTDKGNVFSVKNEQDMKNLLDGLKDYIKNEDAYRRRLEENINEYRKKSYAAQEAFKNFLED